MNLMVRNFGKRSSLMEKCQSPKLDDVGSSPASSAKLQKETKVVCNAASCRLESCSHYWPHEKKKFEKSICMNWQFCSSVGIKVKCEKVVDH